jgi:hypothetical protein
METMWKPERNRAEAMWKHEAAIRTPKGNQVEKPTKTNQQTETLTPFGEKNL